MGYLRRFWQLVLKVEYFFTGPDDIGRRIDATRSRGIATEPRAVQGLSYPRHTSRY